MKAAVCALLVLAIAATQAQDLVVTSMPAARCVIGERGTLSDGTIYFDNLVEAPCADPEAMCAQFVYDQTNEEGTAKIEYGVCMSRNMTWGCDELAAMSASRGYGITSNCTLTKYESGDVGVAFALNPPTGCEDRNADDLLIYPSCTMRQALDKFANCANSYYINFPYENKTECGSQVDMVWACYGRVATECMSGRCPTVSDEVPGAREMMQQARDWGFNTRDLDSALANMVEAGFVNSTDGWRDFILSASCPTIGEVPDFVAMLPELLNTTDFGAMFGEQFGAILSAVPCSENYYNRIGQAWIDVLMQWYSATDKDAACASFNNYKMATTTAFLTECEVMSFSSDMFDAVITEELAPFADSMIRAATLWGEFFFTYNLPGCRMVVNYTTSCVTGVKVSMNGAVIQDNLVNTPCANSEELCVKYEYTTDSMLKVVGGECQPSWRLYDCEAVNNFTLSRGYGNLTECEVSSCNGSFCNDLVATPPTGCSVPTSDIQLLPSCGAMEALEKMNACNMAFYANFPYEDKDACAARSAEFISCMAKVYTDCLDGRCPTVLDAIPGVRATYPLIRDALFGISSIREMTDRLQMHGVLDPMGADIMVQSWDMALCPEITSLPQLVESWFNNFNTTYLAQLFVSMDVDLVKLGENMPCSVSYYTQIASAFQQMMTSMFSATSRDQACSAYDTYFEAVTKSYVEQCDPSKIDDFLYVIVPESMHGLVPYAVQFMEYIGQSFYENPRLSWCLDVTPEVPVTGDVVGLNCDELYKSTTRCGQKKAWLCDYAKWKVDFLGNWLSDYAEYQEVDTAMLPDCYRRSDFNGLCRNANQLTCVNVPVIDCPMCYCADHKYTDLSGLTAIYRSDYRMWREFFAAYRRTSSSMTSSSSSDNCDV